MIKTTVYLPEELEVRLDAESAATGISKAELIRRSIALLLDHAERPKRSRELPVFDSGRSLTPDEMNESVYEHIKERAARR
ncbi:MULTISPECIES: CopG family transcriptional regulator [unclassified Streptomyces]|uniref:ribbon-helix-helix domain-containing protein n=1 Tax=unclassified Streptomyces TaxID=2593676 RepID=UPI00093F8C78|nr:MULTISPECIES: CopG family transcriptional regulator [unclassified Streptomyces]MBT2380670.1 ribbon-helix-helix protein, CopG family [Streptomyces sp. ISL-111]MBT2428013.1 ribbon-helix-helix protein, CopG family [Streptomyces sp. ISL-112]MBT2461624.1 ribbon-helix-helix protein, CopG family [Streptomyces sp. ISL-63]